MRMPGRDVVLPSVGGRIGRILLAGRWYEQEMLDYIRSLEISGNYLDVGANIGNHTVYFAVNTAAERVFAFEPVRGARKLLNGFIEANNLWTKVSVLPYACSDSNGHVGVITSAVPGIEPITLPCRRLDDLMPLPVSLIKMDIEGAEPSALRGAVGLLQRSRPRLFIESHDDAHMKAILEIIAPIGYRTTGRVWNASPTYEFVAGAD